MSRLLVLCPLPEEAAGVVLRLEGRAAADPAHGPRAWSGRLGGREALVRVTGDGPGRAAAAGAAAVGVDAVVIAGVAGALTPDLCRGDLVAATEVYDEASGARAGGPGGRQVAAAVGALPAPVLTARRIAPHPDARRRLRAAWIPAPAVVDLETWPLVDAATRAGLPWAVLRAVSDTFGEGLPRYLEACRRADGSVDRAAVARAALARPWTLAALARLRRGLADCAAVLGTACERLARSGWPDAAVGGFGALDSRVDTP